MVRNMDIWPGLWSGIWTYGEDFGQEYGHMVRELGKDGRLWWGQARQRWSPAVCSRHRCWPLLHQTAKADEETVADVGETVLWGDVVVPFERLLTRERLKQHTRSRGWSCAGSTGWVPLSAWSTQCNPRLWGWTLGKEKCKFYGRPK